MRCRTAIDVEGNAHTLYPIWATRQTVRELLGIGEKMLMALAIEGEVDFRKMTDNRQGGALYRFADVLAWVEARRNPHAAARKQAVMDAKADRGEDFEV